MIICQNCEKIIVKDPSNQNYVCKACGEKYPIIDGVPYFKKNIDDNEYNEKEYQTEIDKIAQAEDENFWFKSRSNLILQIFNKFISKKSKVIEIGAGTGNIARKLSNSGYSLSIGEIHPSGIKYALEKNNEHLSIPIYQFDIMSNPFRNEFDVVCFFDVLEHIKADKKALKNINKMLVKGGRIVLTVPAHMWLWCEEDEVSNHFRRYDISSLKTILEEEGFYIEYATNFFISITPLLYVRTKMKASEAITINPFINSVLYVISNLENKILRFISSKVGGSIIIVAKNDPLQ